MKSISILIITLLFTIQSLAQNDFIQIKTSKVICLLTFIEASGYHPGTSQSYSNYIMQHLGDDEEFIKNINQYGSIHIEYSAHRDRYPENRHIYLNSKDLIWVAASNAIDINDFSERIIGYLPHNTHIELIEILERIEPYYDNLIWNKQQKQIERIENNLDKYKNQIEELFIKISTFYDANWNKKVPFQISLYPIPLKSGGTTAIPKGNALICGFLSEDDLAYQGLIGVAVHEMCHIIFDEQTEEVQNQIDDWYTTSDSPFSGIAYNYINEGLATALGNGWAYKQINGRLDIVDWYSDKYIDGFGHALYPLINEYLNKNKPIDHAFVKESIDLFGKTFPKSATNTNILMSSILVFGYSEADKEIDVIYNSLFENFNMQSIISTHINDAQSPELFDQKKIIKLFVIDKNNEESINTIDNHYTNIDISTPLNSMEIKLDSASNSYLIIVNIEDLHYISNAMKKLGEIDYLESDLRITLDKK